MKMTDFAEILDRCVADVQQGQATLASCLAQYPQYADQLATLLPIAEQLPAMPAASLSTEKRQSIQAQLLKRVTERQAERPGRVIAKPALLVWRRLLPAVFAVMVILSLAGWGVTSASAASVPGDALYPVKRLSEQVAVALAPAEGRPDLHVTLARRRLAEYESLSARGEIEPTLIVEAAIEIDTALSQVESADVATPQVSVEQVALQAETQLQTLANRVAALPVDQQAEVQSARTLFAASRARMAEIMKTHPAATPPGRGDPGRWTPTATGTASLTPTGTATLTPTGTATLTPQPTATVTAVPTIDSPVSPTPPAKTPPGLVKTPPGLAKTPNTPPGLVNTPNTPPGLVDKTPKPKK
jgi:hypothetical protein